MIKYIEIIDNSYCTHKVRADILKGLAIHRTYLDHSLFTVSHISTGRALCQRIKNRKMAIQARKEFLRIMNWNSVSDPESRKFTKKIKAKVTKIKEKFYSTDEEAIND